MVLNKSTLPTKFPNRIVRTRFVDYDLYETLYGYVYILMTFVLGNLGKHFLTLMTIEVVSLDALFYHVVPPCTIKFTYCI